MGAKKTPLGCGNLTITISKQSISQIDALPDGTDPIAMVENAQ